MSKVLKKLETPSPKAKNMLIRYNCSTALQTNSKYEHPERSYFLRYFPKYYHHLIIETTQKDALLSKIKRIKRLKKFTGLFKQNIPQASLWLNLLRDTRKTIEEVPILGSTSSRLRVNQLFWRKLYHQNLKSFLNITRVGSQRLVNALIFEDQFMNPMMKNLFIHYIKGMRKLKELKISVDLKNFKEIKWLFGKLDKMKGLLCALEHIKLEFIDNGLAISELFQCKNVLHYLTSLKFSWRLTEFDPNICIIPQICPNLTSLSMGLERFFTEDPEFIKFLEEVQRLPKLISLQFSWSKDLKLFWSHFKPQSSPRSLNLSFDASEILTQGLFGTDDRDYLLEMMKSKDLTRNLFADLIKDWDSDIKELENIEFNIYCSRLDDVPVASVFITGVLHKVQKLTCFKCQILKQVEWAFNSVDYEPFVIKSVPHLYESLEKLEIQIESGRLNCRPQLSFDLKKLKVFKNLKAIKLSGEEFSEVNIEEAIILLEDNQKEGGYPLLELEGFGVYSKEGLKNMLERISQAKRPDKCLKIQLDLSSQVGMGGDEIEYLESFCKVIQESKVIEGLQLELFLSDIDTAKPNELAVKKILRKYPEMKNVVISLDYFDGLVKCIRVDGEKEQFFVDYYD